MWGLDETTVENTLFAIVFALALFFVSQIGWLLARRRREVAKQRRLARLDRDYTDALLDALDADDERAAASLSSLRRGDLRDWLTAIAARTTGDYLNRIRGLYRRLGLAQHDLAKLGRAGRQSQLVIARRLVLMAPSELLAGSRRVRLRSYGARLLLLMAFGPDEPVSLLLQQLRNWPPVDELQGHPLRIVLRRLRPEQHATLMAHWSEIDAPSVRALVLREACLELPERQAPWLRSAFESRHAVLRKAACDICGEMGRVDQAVRITTAAHDSDPAVREAAVRCLGRLGVGSAQDALVGSLRDAAYEVQLAAAVSLFKVGPEGRAQLQFARRLHPDGRCRDIVAMVLDELGAEAA